MPLQIGEVIDGKYRIVSQLGAGAMGEVYAGENLRIKRSVAIKVLLPGVATKDDVVQRFEHEAQAAGRIGSDHIVEVLDLGKLPGGSLYMVMEFLDGMTLSERIRQHGRLTPRQVTPIVQQLLTGLEAAHQAKIIHRDLKPDNIFLQRENAGQADFVKILDFGVSKFNPLSGDDNMRMTATGTIMGTPYYMAPEQAKGARNIDARSDLYSVGVILYECITGQVPFNAQTFNELIFKIVLETPPPATTFVPDLDPEFDRLIRRAMAREPADRFSTAGELRDALSVWLHGGRLAASSMTPPPRGSLVGSAPPGNPMMNAVDNAPISDDAPTMYAAASPFAAMSQMVPDEVTNEMEVIPATSAHAWPADPIGPIPGVPRYSANKRLLFLLVVVVGIVLLGAGGWAALTTAGDSDKTASQTDRESDDDDSSDRDDDKADAKPKEGPKSAGDSAEKDKETAEEAEEPPEPRPKPKVRRRRRTSKKKAATTPAPPPKPKPATQALPPPSKPAKKSPRPGRKISTEL